MSCFNSLVTHWWFVKISLRCCHAPRVGNGACSHKIDCVQFFLRFPNLKGHQTALLVQEFSNFADKRELFLLDKVGKLVSGGSVINGAYPSSFHKGKGVSGPIQNFWGTFLYPNNFGIFGRNGGWGLTKSKKICALFFPNCWWNMTQKVPQKFWKKVANGKVPQKFQIPVLSV